MIKNYLKDLNQTIDFIYMMLNALIRSHGDGTIAGKGRENFGLSLAFIAFEKRGNFIVSYLLRSGPRCKRSHLKERPI